MADATADDAGPRNFAGALAELADGELNVKLGVEQQKLLRELREQAIAAGSAGKVKGTIALTLRYEVSANGALAIVPTMKVTTPKPPVPATCVWVDKSSNISWQDPRQQKLPLREVPGTGPAKDVHGKKTQN